MERKQKMYHHVNIIEALINRTIKTIIYWKIYQRKYLGTS